MKSIYILHHGYEINCIHFKRGISSLCHVTVTLWFMFTTLYRQLRTTQPAGQTTSPCTTEPRVTWRWWWLPLGCCTSVPAPQNFHGCHRSPPSSQYHLLAQRCQTSLWDRTKDSRETNEWNKITVWERVYLGYADIESVRIRTIFWAYTGVCRTT